MAEIDYMLTTAEISLYRCRYYEKKKGFLHVKQLNEDTVFITRLISLIFNHSKIYRNLTPETRGQFPKTLQKF